MNYKKHDKKDVLVLERLFNRNHTCSICDYAFTTKKVKSRFIRPISHDTDFCSVYDSVETNPLLYYVSVCPNCGYSMTDEFTSYFPPGTINAIRNKIQKHWQKKSYGEVRTVQTAINTYKLGIYSGLIKKEASIVMSGMYLRLAWIYRTVEKNEIQELRFLKLAADQFERSYSNGDFAETSMSEIKLLYLIGELHTRLGNTRQAIRYFQLVLQHKDKDTQVRLVEKSRDRWYEIRTAQKQLHMQT
ncbi:DUF2225 domain-containing protein [Bacillus tianshenii]|uniref:DUF2225 domain-containing protein n=1 Tax=Sutcliffiella tianshenii TaxID=1463404 RepID=UPI001CD31FEF|nr:DUF2225 domain-containing protein [Bacillus tianshenii]MCA1319762.1 DUF2225 domain-containing protein [Bacillus tianshenii]